MIHASNACRVRNDNMSTDTTTAFGDACLPESFWRRVFVSGSGCWLWRGQLHRTGYGNAWCTRTRKKAPAHRVSWIAFNGPTDLFVLHRCDVRPCVNPQHLFAGTQSDNIRDCVSKGRHRPWPRFGSRNPRFSVTDEIIMAVEDELSHPWRLQRETAKAFGISISSVERIKAGTVRLPQPPQPALVVVEGRLVS